MSDLANRIRRARKESGLSQSELARRVGLKPQAIQAIEAGKVQKPRHLLEIAAVLGVDPSELAAEEDGSFIVGMITHMPFEVARQPNTPPKTVPIVGIARAGLEAIDYSTGQGELGEVDAPAGATDKTVAVEARGGSMGGRVEDGDIVFYEDRREPVTEDLIGRLCIVGCSDGRVLIKRLRKGSREGLFHLISYAEEPEFDVPVDWAAKITNIRPA